MNILYEQPIEEIELNGVFYPIKTDFRDWLRLLDSYEDVPPEQQVVGLLGMFKTLPPQHLIPKAIEELLEFARAYEPQSTVQSDNGVKTTDSPLSWSFDSPFIYAGFLECYHIDLLKIDTMHWHIFLGLFQALPEDTPIKKRMAYRSVNLATIKDKKERQRIRKIQQSIQIPRKPLDALQVGAFFDM